WLIHGHLSLGDTRFDRGNVWQYFVYEFLPNHSSFSQNDLLNACTETFPILSSAALQKLVRLVLNTYIDGQAIAKNRFLILNQKQYSTGQSDLSNPYTVGYLLAKTWERDFQSRQAVLVDEIIDTERGLASLLGVNQEQLRQHLDILATHSLIEQRSAKPHLSTLKPPLREAGESSYQVYRCWETPIELLKKAYEADQATPNQPLSKALEGILQDSDDDVPDFSQFLEWASGLIPQPGDIRLEIGLAS
nr:hypothetical protein [Oculatellaceae cyanobacterium Prado106]